MNSRYITHTRLRTVRTIVDIFAQYVFLINFLKGNSIVQTLDLSDNDMGP